MSLFGHLVERQSLIEKSRQAPLLDGVFAVLLYNEFQRRLGPPPYAETVELTEAFPSATEKRISNTPMPKRRNSCLARIGLVSYILAHRFKNSAGR